MLSRLGLLRRMTTLVFNSQASAQGVAPATIVLGEKPLLDLTKNALLKQKLPSSLPSTAVRPLFVDIGSSEGKGASVTTFHTGSDTLESFVFASIPSERTRHNAILRVDAVPDLVKKHTPAKADARIVIALSDPAQAFAAGCAVARAFPLYSRKSSTPATRTVSVDFVCEGADKIDVARIQVASNAIRLAARLVDTPPCCLHTDAFVEEARAVQRRLEHKGVTLTIKQGETLKNEGFGGLWGVGKASEHPPALVVLSYVPAAANKTLALVGKGIVFDTGGLSIKGSTYMPTMKCDMGGAASVMAGFEAAVLSGTKVALHAVLCIAENSVDARSTRPDDILQLYSGKTVEINNTDAEGRLVLADGVAYATKHLNPDILIDMATLTGAQSFATGNIHCGVMSNSSELEQTIVTAGKKSGDLAFPLIYSPEFLGIEKQFSSEVADFKNSVKDRTNASSAGAGHFIEENLIGDKWSWKNGDRKDTGLYAHLDIAAPAFTSDRGTGFGVALLLETIKSLE